MCGIIGFIGKKRAAPLAYNGLRDLEYRGYDSWGIASLGTHGIDSVKKVGKIGDSDAETVAHLVGKVAIGHSRWATHGKVTTENAHPHFNHDKSIAVVHNGIVENWQELKTGLTDVKFVSETDTEVIPHLISKHMDFGFSFVEACVSTANSLSGRYAFLAICKDENIIFAARCGSPLIIGKAKEGTFIASDVPAFLDHTNVVNYLDDREYVILNDSGAKVYSLDNKEEVRKNDVQIKWEKEVAKKGNFEHFMLKEILEQRQTLARAIEQDERALLAAAREISISKRVLLLGCGTAGNVCKTARYLFTEIGHKQVSFVEPSEFELYEQFIGTDTLIVAVSQSGETADVLDAIVRGKERGAKILSILNVRGSSVERISDYTFQIGAGPEIAVASTKATSAQIVTLFLLAYALKGQIEEGKRLVLETVAELNRWLNPRFLGHVRRVADSLLYAEHIYVIGRSYNYPIAEEAALKIQEISYIHAEGFAGGEIKHGPIALISKGTPVIALVNEGKGKAEILSNISELAARGAYVIGISEKEENGFSDWIHIPGGEFIAPIVSLIPMQLIAYYLATGKKLNPDRPRNLAKSVTVR